jgi:hypothetical protein
MNADKTRINKKPFLFHPRKSAARKSNPGIGLETISRDNRKGKIFSNQPTSPGQCAGNVRGLYTAIAVVAAVLHKEDDHAKICNRT